MHLFAKVMEFQLDAPFSHIKCRIWNIKSNL